MSATFRNPSRAEIRDLLASARTIAVVGLSDDPLRPSFGVTESMRDYGYRILPVNPSIQAWEGVPAFATVTDAAASLAPGERIDIVNVFRRPARVGELVEECVRLGVPAMWLQLGVVNEPAALRAVEAGIKVVMDRCIYVDRAEMITG